MHFPVVDTLPPHSSTEPETAEDLLQVPLLEGVSYHPPSITRPKDVTNKRNKEIVHLAFELMGGVSRLAEWGNRNPTKFYTSVWARTLPLASNEVMGDNSEIVFRLATPVKTIDLDPVEDNVQRSGDG